MQGLKALIPFVKKQKTWLCPLLCIAASVLTAYFLHLPDWVLVGIISGAACNKLYDWAGDVKAVVNRTMMILFTIFLLALVFVSGCSAESKEDYYNNARQLTWATNGCTFAAPVLKLRGDIATLAGMTTAVHGAHNCSTCWYWYVTDPNLNPPPDIFACALSGWPEIINLLKKADIDVNEPALLDNSSKLRLSTYARENKKDVNDLECMLTLGPGPQPAKLTDDEVTKDMLDSAKAGLDAAVVRFDTAAIIFFKPED